MKAVLARIDEVNLEGNIFTREALRQMAREDERCTFDEDTGILWLESKNDDDPLIL